MERNPKAPERRASFLGQRVTSRQGIAGLLAGVGGVIAYGVAVEAVGFDLDDDAGTIEGSLLGIGVLIAFFGSALWAARLTGPATGSRAVRAFRPWIVGALAAVGGVLLAAMTLASTGAFGAPDPGTAERTAPDLVILAAGISAASGRDAPPADYRFSPQGKVAGQRLGGVTKLQPAGHVL